MLTLHSWPQAIVHVDADAFFASVEQSLHPEYRGKPVITGKERNIVACASYEAKRRGVRRAMPLHEARKVCPDAIIVPSDYETYSIISKRMFAIMRRFTPVVEEYSIDEAFADISGLRRMYRASYETIAERMKQALEDDLGITVSVGLSLSKSLAKLASKKKKPAGFMSFPGQEIHFLLCDTPLEKVWGFGPNTTALLTKLGLTTAYDFVQKPRVFAHRVLGKIGDELWRELRGEAVYPVLTEEKKSYQSISKMKTFTPASSDKRYVYGMLVRNLESACIKARRYDLASASISIYLREQDFHGAGVEIKLSRPSSHPLEILLPLREGFEKLFSPSKQYRATAVVLTHLEEVSTLQPTLFEDTLRLTKIESLSKAIDTLSAQFGKHAVHVGSSFPADKHRRHQGERGNAPQRRSELLQGETARQRLNLPFFTLAKI